MLSHVLGEGATGHVLHYLGQHGEAVVGVGPLGAGSHLGPQGAAVEGGQIGARRAGPAHTPRGTVDQVGDPGQLADARGVGEEVAEGDIGPAGRSLDAEGLEVVVDRLVELEATVLVQLHQTYGGQGLGDGGDSEHGVGGDGPAPAPVGHSHALDGGLFAR